MNAEERNEYDRNRMEIRKAERSMAAEEHELEGELKAFDADLSRAERRIDDELRAEHHGHEPEHMPFWRTGAPGKAHEPH
jgi:cell division septum initiation protein DivIVA